MQKSETAEPGNGRTLMVQIRDRDDSTAVYASDGVPNRWTEFARWLVSPPVYVD